MEVNLIVLWSKKILMLSYRAFRTMEAPSAVIQDNNPLHGKVRLGHCIYLTQQQKERINKLGIPIEICPSCHSKLNWHLEKILTQ